MRTLTRSRSGLTSSQLGDAGIRAEPEPYLVTAGADSPAHRARFHQEGMTMPVHETPPSPPISGDGDGHDLAESLESLARQYGNRFLREAAPDNRMPEH